MQRKVQGGELELGVAGLGRCLGSSPLRELWQVLELGQPYFGRLSQAAVWRKGPGSTEEGQRGSLMLPSSQNWPPEGTVGQQAMGTSVSVRMCAGTAVHVDCVCECT